MMLQAVTTIDILRHGKTEGGEMFRGRTDVLLSAEGWLQMQQAVKEKAPWELVLTSPLLRCQYFADDLARQRKVECVSVADLREISFGDWDGRLFSDIKQTDAERFQQFWRNPVENTPPNGEPLTQFQSRVSEAFAEVLESHQGKHILMVTHGGVVRAILSEVLHSPLQAMMRLEVPYACISRVVVYHDGDKHWPQLVFHNRNGVV
jgi:alpha-ribazole phosphatase